MKRKVSLLLAVLLIAVLACGCAKKQSESVCGCAESQSELVCDCAKSQPENSSPFVGTWVCDDAPSNYPAQMVLREDGSGVVDGYSFVWSAKETDSEFRLVGGYEGDLRYTYAFDGSNILYLTLLNGDIEVMYEKIG